MAINEVTIQAVWEKGKIVPGYDSNDIRKDQCEAWIIRDMYGNRNSSYGWEIDHLIGNYDNLANLRPLQWENNDNRSDLELVCVITSYEVVNIKIK
jgi:hypothetical protein